MGQVQVRRSENVSLLRADFPPPNLLANAIGAHLAIPSLRGFWPMSGASEGASTFNLIGWPPRTLTNNGYALGMTGSLLPYVTLSAASSQYLYRADEAGLRGSNAYGGWTWGGWFKFASFPGAGLTMGLMGKDGGALASCEYGLRLSESGGTYYLLSVISNGAAYLSSPGFTTGYAIGTWHHIIGRWISATSLDIFLDGVKQSNVAGLPVNLLGAGANFEIGALAGASFINGATTFGFLAGYPLSDAHIGWLHAITAPLFP
jgi:hypothetical protein